MDVSVSACRDTGTVGTARTAMPDDGSLSANTAVAPGARRDSEHRIPTLDGVRGAAILLVMLHHFTRSPQMPERSALADRAFHELAQVGWIGVDLFLVLSGFLITGILYDTKRGEGYLRNFYVRRCLRIFPLYYATLALFLIVAPRLTGHAGLQEVQADAPWYWTYTINLKIAHSGWEAFPALGHFWSLAVEEQFYLVWPFVVLLFDRRMLMCLSLGSIVLALVARVWLIYGAGYAVGAYVLMPARMDALAVGAIVALAWRGPRERAWLSAAARPVFAASGVLLAVLFTWRGGLYSDDPPVVTMGLTLLAVLFGAALVLTLGAAGGSTLERVMGSSPLRFFGRYSYALYVFHHPLLAFVPASLVAAVRLPSVAGSNLPTRLVLMTVLGTISVAVALLSWHLLERHFLALKGYFSYTPARHAEAAAVRAPRPLPSLTRLSHDGRLRLAGLWRARS